MQLAQGTQLMISSACVPVWEKAGATHAPWSTTTRKMSAWKPFGQDVPQSNAKVTVPFLADADQAGGSAAAIVIGGITAQVSNRGGSAGVGSA